MRKRRWMLHTKHRQTLLIHQENSRCRKLRLTKKLMPGKQKQNCLMNYRYMLKPCVVSNKEGLHGIRSQEGALAAVMAMAVNTSPSSVFKLILANFFGVEFLRNVSKFRKGKIKPSSCVHVPHET